MTRMRVPGAGPVSRGTEPGAEPLHGGLAAPDPVVELGAGENRCGPETAPAIEVLPIARRQSHDPSPDRPYRRQPDYSASGAHGHHRSGRGRARFSSGDG